MRRMHFIIAMIMVLILLSGCNVLEGKLNHHVVIHLDKYAIEAVAKEHIEAIFQVDKDFQHKDFEQLVHNYYLHNPYTSLQFLNQLSGIYEDGESLKVADITTDEILINGDKATIVMTLLLEEELSNRSFQQKHRYEGLLWFLENRWWVVSDHLQYDSIDDQPQIPIPLSPEGEANIDDLLHFFNLSILP